MAKGIIYQIFYHHPNHGMIRYIGSTSKTLSKRYKGHLKTFELWQEGNANTIAIYPFWLRYGVDTFAVEEIAEVEYETKKELRQHEQHYINTMPNINCYRAHRTIKDNHDEALKYYHSKSDRLKPIMKIRGRERVLCECGTYYNYSGKTSHIRTNKHNNLISEKNESNNIQ